MGICVEVRGQSRVLLGCGHLLGGSEGNLALHWGVGICVEVRGATSGINSCNLLCDSVSCSLLLILGWLISVS